MNNEVPQQHWKLKARLSTRLCMRLKEAPRCAAAKQTIHEVVLLIMSTDVQTGRGKDDEKNCSEHDETSSQPLVNTGGEEDAHDTIKYTGCSSSCDLGSSGSVTPGFLRCVAQNPRIQLTLN